eukprot:4664721-Prorocentrum_lima.AAC.1
MPPVLQCPPSLPRPPAHRPVPPAESMDFFVRLGQRPPTLTGSTDANRRYGVTALPHGPC